MSNTLILTDTQRSYMNMARSLAEKAKDKGVSRSIAYKCREASKALEALFSAEVLESASANGKAEAAEPANAG